jgi:hypothetical protein
MAKPDILQKTLTLYLKRKKTSLSEAFLLNYPRYLIPVSTSIWSFVHSPPDTENPYTPDLG